jgi:hypothetical protein
MADHVGPLAQNQQATLVVLQEHIYAEFGLKELDAALATMDEDPHYRTWHSADRAT